MNNHDFWCFWQKHRQKTRPFSECPLGRAVVTRNAVRRWDRQSEVPSPRWGLVLWSVGFVKFAHLECWDDGKPMLSFVYGKNTMAKESVFTTRAIARMGGYGGMVLWSSAQFPHFAWFPEVTNIAMWESCKMPEQPFFIIKNRFSLNTKIHKSYVIRRYAPDETSR